MVTGPVAAAHGLMVSVSTDTPRQSPGDRGGRREAEASLVATAPWLAATCSAVGTLVALWFLARGVHALQSRTSRPGWRVSMGFSSRSAS